VPSPDEMPAYLGNPLAGDRICGTCPGHHRAQPPAVTHESDVAEAVSRAANDETGQLRFPAGPDAVVLAQLR